MSRTRNPEITKRNDVIYGEWVRGASLTALGEKYGLSRQVVGRLVAERHPEGGEDDDRAVFRGFMWRLFDEVQEIGEHPGWKMSPRGDAAYGPDGEPALDTNVQVQAKELQLKIIRELRLLDGRDRPQKRVLSMELAQQQADESMAALAAKVEAERRELETLRKQAAQHQVIPGQVERPAIEGLEQVAQQVGLHLRR